MRLLALAHATIGSFVQIFGMFCTEQVTCRNPLQREEQELRSRRLLRPAHTPRRGRHRGSRATVSLAPLSLVTSGRRAIRKSEIEGPDSVGSHGSLNRRLGLETQAVDRSRLQSRKNNAIQASISERLALQQQGIHEATPTPAEVPQAF